MPEGEKALNDSRYIYCTANLRISYTHPLFTSFISINRVQRIKIWGNMKVVNQVVAVLSATELSIPHNAFIPLPDGTFPCATEDPVLRSIPPRNPPIVNPTRALYQDPEQETALRVEDLLSRMPMREKMAQLMQG
jgi:hypothetical protein